MCETGPQTKLSSGDAVDKAPDMLNSYVHWHVDEGRKLTGPYLTRQEQKRTEAYHRMRKLTCDNEAPVCNNYAPTVCDWTVRVSGNYFDYRRRKRQRYLMHLIIGVIEYFAA